MRKLSRGQVARIIDAMEPGHRSVYSIAREHGITPQWVRVLWRRSGHGRTVPAPGRPGRPRKGVPDEVRRRILEAERTYRLHPRALEQILGYPHNTIWAVLKEAGLVTDTVSLQRRRKPWVRFERRFSNSLWQGGVPGRGPGAGGPPFLVGAPPAKVGGAGGRHPPPAPAPGTP